MLDDTQAKVLLTQKSLMSNIPECDILTILVDEDFSDLSLERKDSVLNKATPENIACIFYTSGSTGKPKGVPVPHYAVNRRVRNTNFINFKPSDRIAQDMNFTFDPTTFEIWGALLNGGCLVGVPRDILLVPHDFAQFIQEKNINFVVLTAALFHQFAREVPNTFRSVRDLIIGGEILDPRAGSKKSCNRALLTD